MWKLWFKLNTAFAAVMLAGLLLVSRFHGRVESRPLIILAIIGGLAFGVRSYRMLRREHTRQHKQLTVLVEQLQPIVDDMARLPWAELNLFRQASKDGPTPFEIVVEIGTASNDICARLTRLRWMRLTFDKQEVAAPDNALRIQYVSTGQGTAGFRDLVSAASLRRAYFQRQAQEAAAA